MTTITLPRVQMGKRKERSNMTRIVTFDGRLVTKELIVAEECMVDDGSRHTYQIDRANMFLDGDGIYYQLLHEGDHIPVDPVVPSKYADGKNDSKEFADLRNNLFSRTRKLAIADSYEDAKKNDQWNKLMWLFTIIFGSMVLMAGMHYFGG